MKPTDKTTTIDGYLVEFEVDEDGRTQCCINGPKGTASLSALETTGCLSDSNGNEHALSPRIVEKIIRWAYAAGY
jgi:hypothetical protein